MAVGSNEYACMVIGSGVGTCIDAIIRVDMGIGLTVSVGMREGDAVGNGVAVSVDLGEGTAVGNGVAVSVGLGEGTAVGNGVAVSVGVGIGFTVFIGRRDGGSQVTVGTASGGTVAIRDGVTNGTLCDIFTSRIVVVVTGKAVAVGISGLGEHAVRKATKTTGSIIPANLKLVSAQCR